MVTVIMPTYNTEENFLRQSIESILNQTYRDIEFIIINDGGKKDEKIIKEYKDKRIKVINHENNKGLPKSLNEGIELARGQYIARMDSDDIAKKDRIETQVKYMEKNKHIDICGMFAKKIGDNNNYSLTTLYSEEEIKCQLLFRTMLIHPTVMFRTDFLRKYNLNYNEDFKYAQDFEMWSRCSEKCNITIIPRVGLYLRIHEKQISTEKKGEQDKYYLRTLQNNINRMNCYANNEKLLCSLKILSEKEELTNENCVSVVESINELVSFNNNYYENLILKKVLINTFFNVFIKKCRTNIIMLKLLNNKTIRKNILNFNNLILLAKRVILILKVSLIEKVKK